MNQPQKSAKRTIVTFVYKVLDMNSNLICMAWPKHLPAGGLRDQSGSYANGFAALIGLAILGTITVSFLPARNEIEVLPLCGENKTPAHGKCFHQILFRWHRSP